MRSQSTAAEASSNAIHDRLADTYGYGVDDTFAAQLKYRLVLRYAPADSRVLDVGCANGLHLRVIAPHCREIVGIDINHRMLDLARDAISADGVANATVCEMNATSLAFDDASFDVAYSFSTLLLINEAEHAIAELARVLRPGGVAVLDLTGRRNLSQRHWDVWYREQGHPGLRSFTWRRACETLAEARLQIVEAPALGLLDQWRYVPVMRRARFLDRVLHRDPNHDLDYAVSNRRPFRRLANRWYIVARKQP
jgi:ubiquinone/menaquinone biosynthesis C-methylase UbiE